MRQIVFTALLVLLTACAPTAHTTDDEPICRIGVTSVTHVGFLAALGCGDMIVGVCNRNLVYTPLSDSVIDFGDAIQPNVEKILHSGAQVLFVTTYAGPQPWMEQVKQAGIRVVEVNEWKENHPLKRAEWIKAIGRVMGQEHKADSIYEEVCARYETEKAKSNGCSIVSGQDFRGTWYVPAGGTFMGQLFRDAGAIYYYEDDPRTESIPLSTEQAIRTFMNAEIWVGVNARTRQELLSQDAKHAWMKAFQSGQVYHFLRRSTNTGANDFWERGVVHPEEILHDLRLVVHHEEDSTLKYIGKLDD